MVVRARRRARTAPVGVAGGVLGRRDRRPARARRARARGRCHRAQVERPRRCPRRLRAAERRERLAGKARKAGRRAPGSSTCRGKPRRALRFAAGGDTAPARSPAVPAADLPEQDERLGERCAQSSWARLDGQGELPGELAGRGVICAPARGCGNRRGAGVAGAPWWRRCPLDKPAFSSPRGPLDVRVRGTCARSRWLWTRRRVDAHA